MILTECSAPTISIYVNAAGVSLSIVIGVCLQWVAFKGTVVAAVAHTVPVRVKLPWVVHQRAVILRQTSTFRCTYYNVNIHLSSTTWSHPLVHDAVIVIIRITRISQFVHVQVFLSRVWHRGAVILQPITTQINQSTFSQFTASDSDAVS